MGASKSKDSRKEDETGCQQEDPAETQGKTVLASLAELEKSIENQLDKSLNYGGKVYKIFCKQQPSRWTVAILFVLFLPLWIVMGILLGGFIAYLHAFKPPQWIESIPPAVRPVLGLPDRTPVIVVEGEDPRLILAAEVPSNCKIQTKGMNWEFPFNFDVGIYWYHLGNTCEKGPHTKYFDRSKPTVLYIHGWEPGTTARGFRETVNWINDEDAHNPDFEDTFSLDVWLSAGYNVGIFYWNQWSDEPLVTDAERKIYNSNSGTRMRWIRQGLDGELAFIQNAKHDTFCVADVLLREYISHFEQLDQECGPVHLVGHSLGSQLTLEFSRKLALSQVCRLFPRRITLLDPFFSKGQKDYLPLCGMKTSERAAETVNLLLDVEPDLVIETYETSLAGSGALGSIDERLKASTIYHRVNMMQFPWFNIGARHCCAVHLYFCSFVQKGDYQEAFFNAHLPHELLRDRMPRVSKAMRENIINTNNDSLTIS